MLSTERRQGHSLGCFSPHSPRPAALSYRTNFLFKFFFTLNFFAAPPPRFVSRTPPPRSGPPALSPRPLAPSLPCQKGSLLVSYFPHPPPPPPPPPAPQTCLFMQTSPGSPRPLLHLIKCLVCFSLPVNNPGSQTSPFLRISIPLFLSVNQRRL